MDNIRKEAKEYIAEIKKNLFCPASEKKGMVEDFQNMVFDYIEENSVTDIGEVYQQFGTPKEIAKQLLCDMDPQRIKKNGEHQKGGHCGCRHCLVHAVVYADHGNNHRRNTRLFCCGAHYRSPRNNASKS